MKRAPKIEPSTLSVSFELHMWLIVIFNIFVMKRNMAIGTKHGKSDHWTRAAPKLGRQRLVRGLQAAVALLLVGSGLFVWQQTGRMGSDAAPTQGYVLVKSYPHARDAYCQGLVYHNGFLYESTGGYGDSSLRKVKLETGEVIQKRELDDRWFGEGIAIWKDRIVQLTWKSRQAFVYDLKTFQLQERLGYRGQGWGLTHDGRHFIMSNGTETLRFLDPETFGVKRQITVRDGRRRVKKLNDLEYVEGEIYANIWYDDRIVRISPRTGTVLGWLDLSNLYPKSRRPHRDAVLNGIAYDPQQQRLLVTGKNWPRLYEIRLPE
ncbi:MAG: glutaminyl-peptide cyclotransferase [bacterium]